MGEDDICMMTRLTKTGSRFEREDLFPVPFLPIVPQVAAAL
jgi:protein-L-isoaspartate(D-aspartate) O-methyltransferase